MTSATTSPGPPAELRIGGAPVRLPEQVGGCLARAVEAIEGSFGDPERAASIAVEWLAAAAVADIQQHQQTFLASSRESALLCDLYRRAFERSPAWGAIRAAGAPPGRPVETPRAPMRVTYIIPQLADGQGPSERLVATLRRHDPGAFRSSVIVTETLTRRDASCGALTCPPAPSAGLGPSCFAALNELGIETAVTPTTGTLVDAALGVVAAARALAPDVAVFIGSPACPALVGAALAGVAPVQIQQNTGVPMPARHAGRGIDAVVYHNPGRADAERDHLAELGVRAEAVEGVGTDLARARAAEQLPRAALGVPAGDPLLISASNKIGVRLVHGSFARDLAAFLRANPDARWVGVGGGAALPEARRLLAREGLADRAKLAGPLGDIRPAIKAADIMLNEYPEGGGNTVLESMACGVPVVAMRAGDRHAESVGAHLVGPPDAIPSNDRAAYWSLASRWLTDPAARRDAARRQSERAVARFSIDQTVRSYERIYHAAARATAPAG